MHLLGCPCNSDGWGHYATCTCDQIRQDTLASSLDRNTQALRDTDNGKDAEIERLRAQVQELANTGEQFNMEAWNILRHEYGEEFRIADSDASPWARKMRRFLTASDAHIAALRRAGVRSA